MAVIRTISLENGTWLSREGRRVGQKDVRAIARFGGDMLVWVVGRARGATGRNAIAWRKSERDANCPVPDVEILEDEGRSIKREELGTMKKLME